MYQSDDVIILDACRTPIGSFKGSLSTLKAHELGGAVIKELVRRNGLQPDNVSEVIYGQVLTAGQGQNPVRQAAVKGNLPYSVPAMSVNMVCGSGLKAVALGYQAIKNQDSAIVIAGGQESMSQAEHSMHCRGDLKFGDAVLKDTMMSDGLIDAFHLYHMGITAENVAQKWEVCREEQDQFALESQHKCEEACLKGNFSNEIIAIKVESRKGITEVTKDEHPRCGSSLTALQRLRPAFLHDGRGTVTAGNSSGLNDGAAGVVLMTYAHALKLGAKEPLARIVSWAQVGVDPSVMGIAPITAIKKALAKASWTIDEVDLFEINEAFASQSVAILKDLKIDKNKVNVSGGAIALGHPIGASGARILVTLLHGMKRLNKRRGVASLCTGGGMGVAMCVERF